MKIDAFKPLKWRNSLRQIAYTCFVVKNPDDAHLLNNETHDETCIHNLPREFLHFRASCASIYVFIFPA